MKCITKYLFRAILKTAVKKFIVAVPREVSLGNLDLVGYSISTSLKNNKKQKDIPPFYHDVYDNKKLEQLNDPGSELKMYCVFDFHDNMEDFDYYIAVEDKMLSAERECVKTRLKGSMYIRVEFLKRNHRAVGMVIMYMKEVWLRANGYKEKNAPLFILYDGRFHSNYQAYGCKSGNYAGEPVATLYIPVSDRQ